jgi:amicyanin
MNIGKMTKRALIGTALGAGIALGSVLLAAALQSSLLPVTYQPELVPAADKNVLTTEPVRATDKTIPSPESVRAAGAVVKIENFTFDQQRITIKVGTTVTWVNDDDIPHTATSTNKLFNSKVLDTNDKFSFTFTTPGTYEYFCALHPHMKGSIVVEAL